MRLKQSHDVPDIFGIIGSIEELKMSQYTRTITVLTSIPHQKPDARWLSRNVAHAEILLPHKAVRVSTIDDGVRQTVNLLSRANHEVALIRRHQAINGNIDTMSERISRRTTRKSGNVVLAVEEIESAALKFLRYAQNYRDKPFKDDTLVELIPHLRVRLSDEMFARRERELAALFGDGAAVPRERELAALLRDGEGAPKAAATSPETKVKAAPLQKPARTRLEPTLGIPVEAPKAEVAPVPADAAAPVIEPAAGTAITDIATTDTPAEDRIITHMLMPTGFRHGADEGLTGFVMADVDIRTAGDGGIEISDIRVRSAFEPILAEDVETAFQAEFKAARAAKPVAAEISVDEWINEVGLGTRVAMSS
jgi:hypothetical protein